MKSTIKNNTISITCDTLGAELTSAKNLSDDYEYIWQKPDDSLRMQAPILFPVIAGLDNDKYVFQGETYNMGLHGFIRYEQFKVIEKTENSVSYKFKSNDETLKIYPFEFELIARYKIKGNKLSIFNEVTNTDNKTIYFSIGAHPAFNCPFNNDEEFSDYYIELEHKETVQRRCIELFMLTGERKPFLKDSNIISLTNDSFKKLAIILDNLKSNHVTLKSSKSNRVISVEFEGFPYLAFWSTKQGGPMLCIEPWYGVPSVRGENLPLDKKEGIQSLAAGKRFGCSYSILFN